MNENEIRSLYLASAVPLLLVGLFIIFIVLFGNYDRTITTTGFINGLIIFLIAIVPSIYFCAFKFYEYNKKVHSLKLTKVGILINAAYYVFIFIFIFLMIISII